MNETQNKTGRIRRLARPFLAGIFAVFPIVLTIAIVVWLGSIIHGLVGPGSVFGNVLRNVGLKFATSEAAAYLVGVALAIAVIYLLGILVETRLKRRWQSVTDRILNKVPVVNTIYDASKKIAQMIEPQDDLEMKSMRPVLCRLGGESGGVFPAFLPTRKTVRISDKEYHVVMIPTAPMLFGGAILCVPKEAVTPLDCGIDGVFNIYMSMGVKMPDYFKEAAGPGQAEDAAAHD